MKPRWLVVAAVVAILWLLVFVKAASISVEPEHAPQSTESAPRSAPIPVKSIEQIISEAAERHGIDGDKFLATAKCESSLRPAVVGDDGESIGLFQIHLPSWTEVTPALASDPEWAAEWAAVKFKEDPTIWVCYQKLYGRTGTIHQ